MLGVARTDYVLKERELMAMAEFTVHVRIKRDWRVRVALRLISLASRLAGFTLVVKDDPQ